MKIAVTYENGQIFQHFGHAEQFKLYEAVDGKITHTEVVDTNGSGHGALAGFLMQNGVDTLICGGIGGGAQAALAEAGIKLYGAPCCWRCPCWAPCWPDVPVLLPTAALKWKGIPFPSRPCAFLFLFPLRGLW